MNKFKVGDKVIIFLLNHPAHNRIGNISEVISQSLYNVTLDIGTTSFFEYELSLIQDEFKINDFVMYIDEDITGHIEVGSPYQVEGVKPNWISISTHAYPYGCWFESKHFKLYNSLGVHQHTMKEYIGFSEAYKYCTTCNHKEVV